MHGTEPRRVRDRIDSFGPCEACAIRHREVEYDAELVPHNEPGLRANIAERGQCVQERAQRDKQEDGGGQSYHGEQCAPQSATQVAEYDRCSCHYAPPAIAPCSRSAPLSRCSVRVARSAAFGSCVTITIVLLNSRFS